MSGLDRGQLVERVRESHARERGLIDGLTDDEVRAQSALPGWTRGHVLAARLAFVRAADRQIAYALAGLQIDFYDGGRKGRDAAIAANADRHADDLVVEMHQATRTLDHAWLRLADSDFDRRVRYRHGGTLYDLLKASWREVEVHCVDLNLGVRPSTWPPELCDQLFEFLAPRVPDGVQVKLNTPDGRHWTLGRGGLVQITGGHADLAAWLAGRQPEGPLHSSTGTLPDLRRLPGA
ncbi:maleylpyruvate isomerase family mycothiol-dependent enzyme [Micromonospora sp. CPCC 206061]|uniref:maleylpyruvate isomerase family mycothiol-dependent enzyme n=1 Tax=Micromonospora sp. CPCC 206061 TaxID=3122410 RepID=UPI002FF219AA